MTRPSIAVGAATVAFLIGLMAIVALTGLALFVAASPAKAQDRDGKFAVWFAQQYNEHHGWCCNQADGHPFDGNYTINPDGTARGPDDQERAVKAVEGMVGKRLTYRVTDR